MRNVKGIMGERLMRVVEGKTWFLERLIHESEHTCVMMMMMMGRWVQWFVYFNNKI